KFSYRLVERVAFATIAGNNRRVPRPRVCQRQRPSAEAAIVVEGFDTLEFGIALQFRKLTNEEFACVNPPPTQKTVGRPLCEALSEYDPAAFVIERQFKIGI